MLGWGITWLFLNDAEILANNYLDLSPLLESAMLLFSQPFQLGHFNASIQLWQIKRPLVYMRGS